MSNNSSVAYKEVKQHQYLSVQHGSLRYLFIILLEFCGQGYFSPVTVLQGILTTVGAHGSDQVDLGAKLTSELPHTQGSLHMWQTISTCG